MPIEIVCGQGHRLKVGEQYAGRKVRCPACQEVVRVPATTEEAIVAPPPLPTVAVSNEYDELDLVAAKVEIDDEPYDLAATRQELLQAMANLQACAFELSLEDYPEERTAIARSFAKEHGDSMEVSRLLVRAPLGCRKCRRKLPAGFGNLLVAEANGQGDPLAPVTPACEFCQGAEAYLLFDPQAAALKSPAVSKLSRDLAAGLLHNHKAVDPVKSRPLSRARRGIGYHRTGLILNLVGLLIQILLAIGGALSGSRGGLVAAAVLSILVGITCQFGSCGFRVAGSIWCAYVPEKSRARTLIRVALGADVAVLLLEMLSLSLSLVFVARPAFGDETRQQAVHACAGLVSIGAWVTFILFLKQLSNYLKAWGTANEAMSVLWFGIVLFVSPAIALFVGVVLIALGRNQFVAIAVIAFFVIGGIVWIVAAFKFWFANVELFGNVQEAITREIGKREVE